MLPSHKVQLHYHHITHNEQQRRQLKHLPLQWQFKTPMKNFNQHDYIHVTVGDIQYSCPAISKTCTSIPYSKLSYRIGEKRNQVSHVTWRFLLPVLIPVPSAAMPMMLLLKVISFLCHLAKALVLSLMGGLSLEYGNGNQTTYGQFWVKLQIQQLSYATQSLIPIIIWCQWCNHRRR